MTNEPKRQPEGIPTGGQFAATAHAEPGVSLEVSAPSGLTIIDGAENNVAWDSPEDQARYLEAASFMEEADIEGTVRPAFTQYRDEDGLDAVELEVDGRSFTIRHAGSMNPEVVFEADGDEDWSFRSEAGEAANRNEHEVLHDVVVSARHDAACHDAWRNDPSEETFRDGDDVAVKDFGVRYAEDGTRIITVDVEKDGRYWELVQRGNEEVQVFLEGKQLSLPFIQLDVLAYDFDEDHIEGTGDIRWKGMMKRAAERAAKEPGYNPRGLNSR